MDEEILELDSLQADNIIKTCRPLGKYWTKQNGLYIGIDNSTGDAWVEEFESYTQMIRWLTTNI